MGFACQDVIPPEYLEELALLQDRIAPFSTELALQIIEQDLGVSTEQLFTEISPQPIAAASLGQVYQARLRPNGKLVAVKVQRPGVRAAMALDLFILRKLAGFAKTLLKLNTDLPSVADEWASSLFKVIHSLPGSFCFLQNDRIERYTDTAMFKNSGNGLSGRSPQWYTIS
ncbi:hypothetical protein KC19_11G154200, partial [Ceratodon purpureus]